MITRLKAPENGIRTVRELRDHLQIAIELEHSTIPPYLCALYSIKDGCNVEAANAIRQVVVEEMLHMTLAANVLNAIGGKPDLLHSQFTPIYPCYLPHGNRSIVLNLAPFSRKSLESFLAIEHPSEKDAPPQAHHYASIGQFYAAIMDAIQRLAKQEKHLFSGSPKRQVSPGFYYNSGGDLTVVDDLETALKALNLIVIEGEGRDTIYDKSHPPLQTRTATLAHYYCFNQIYQGRCYKKGDTPSSGPTGDPFPVDWDSGVYPMRENPTIRNYPPGSELWSLTHNFNLAYSELLRILHQSFNGQPALLQESVPIMFRLKKMAVALMAIPSGHYQTTAGPSFESMLGPSRTRKIL